jgi:hypothetical protein
MTLSERIARGAHDAQREPGAHAPAACAEDRATADRLYAGLQMARDYSSPAYAALRDGYERRTMLGYHAGWGVCRDRQAACSRDDDPSQHDGPTLSPFVRRALRRELPGKALIQA